MTLAGRRSALVALALLLGGCGGSGVGVTPTAARQCAIKYTKSGIKAGTCRSPDGAWLLSFRNATAGWACRLYLRRRGTHRQVLMYRTQNAYCSELAWAKPHLLVFENDDQVMTLAPTTGKLRLIVGFGDFVVSPDGRWVAGFANEPPEIAETVDVVAANGRTCLVVPHTSHQSDEVAGFTRDGKGVIVRRRRFIPNNFATGASQLVPFTISALKAGSAKTGC